jgi:hypothetical protein
MVPKTRYFLRLTTLDGGLQWRCVCFVLAEAIFSVWTQILGPRKLMPHTAASTIIGCLGFRRTGLLASVLVCYRKQDTSRPASRQW